MENWAKKITIWYEKNKRELPWRKDKDPYHVWISEIMLQQTRIEAVLSYYKRFMKELPTVKDLAMVEDEKLMKLWEGLGYYNRARNLKKAAIMVMEKYHGNFPSTYEEILSLPGIGEYTASAIASICFSLPEVTIDGNVLRVYTRVYEDSCTIDLAKERKRIRKNLMEIVPQNSGDFNEGLMEIGETICIPAGVPKCSQCPLYDECLSRKNKTSLNYPVRLVKKEKPIEYYTVFIFYYQDYFFIEKRKKRGLLYGLWQFPNVEGFPSTEEIKRYSRNLGLDIVKIDKGITYTHVFTHKKWNMKSYYIEVSSKNIEQSSGVFVTEDERKKNYSLPGAFQPFQRNFLERRKKEK